MHLTELPSSVQYRVNCEQPNSMPTPVHELVPVLIQWKLRNYSLTSPQRIRSVFLLVSRNLTGTPSARRLELACQPAPSSCIPSCDFTPAIRPCFFLETEHCSIDAPPSLHRSHTCPDVLACRLLLRTQPEKSHSYNTQFHPHRTAKLQTNCPPTKPQKSCPQSHTCTHVECKHHHTEKLYASGPQKRSLRSAAHTSRNEWDSQERNISIFQDAQRDAIVVGGRTHEN